MKKKVISRGFICMMIMILALGLAACGDKENDDKNAKTDEPVKNEKEVDIEKVANSLLSGITFKDQMTKIDEDIFINLYGIEEDDIDESVAYTSTGATAEEIAIFKAENKKAASNIEKQCNLRVETQKTGFENYQPAELAKLSNPVIKKYDTYVAICISDDSPKAEQILESAFK